MYIFNRKMSMFHVFVKYLIFQTLHLKIDKSFLVKNCMTFNLHKIFFFIFFFFFIFVVIVTKTKKCFLKSKMTDTCEPWRDDAFFFFFYR